MGRRKSSKPLAGQMKLKFEPTAAAVVPLVAAESGVVPAESATPTHERWLLVGWTTEHGRFRQGLDVLKGLGRSSAGTPVQVGIMSSDKMIELAGQGKLETLLGTVSRVVLVLCLDSWARPMIAGGIDGRRAWQGKREAVSAVRTLAAAVNRIRSHRVEFKVVGVWSSGFRSRPAGAQPEKNRRRRSSGDRFGLDVRQLADRSPGSSVRLMPDEWEDHSIGDPGPERWNSRDPAVIPHVRRFAVFFAGLIGIEVPVAARSRRGQAA